MQDFGNNALSNDRILKGSLPENILIQGDNKEVLKELQSGFASKIKCIYIDPPYNGGESFHYYNDNLEHERWIRSIREVLVLLEALMSDDGSIWISIDDSEMAYLKVAADEVFGRGNFVTTIIWQQRKSRENRAVFSCNHEYILVYAKNVDKFKKARNLLHVDAEFINQKYKNPDNDPRGPWQSVTANVQDGHAVPSQFYTIVSPAGVRHNPPKGRCWIYNEARMKREIEAGNIWFGKDGRNSPRVKKFLCNAKLGLTPETLWLADDVGTSDSAKKQLMELFPDKQKVFDTPKPEGLLKRIIEIASNEDDYVLDCFLGSGTTIAVAHKLNRRYIGIEIGDQMLDIAAKRMDMVVNGDSSGISKEVGWEGGGRFSFYFMDRCKKRQICRRTETIRPQVSNHAHSQTRIAQLDFMDVLREYPDMIVENASLIKRGNRLPLGRVYDASRNALVCLVKADNEALFLNSSAKIYYTGKRFPASVALNKLYFFVPYIKHKGIKDLYLIRIARVGTRKEGLPENDPNDLRLVFEIEFLKSLYDDYKPFVLKIWHTFTDTTMLELIDAKG